MSESAGVPGESFGEKFPLAIAEGKSKEQMLAEGFALLEEYKNLNSHHFVTDLYKNPALFELLAIVAEESVEAFSYEMLTILATDIHMADPLKKIFFRRLLWHPEMTPRMFEHLRTSYNFTYLGELCACSRTPRQTLQRILLQNSNYAAWRPLVQNEKAGSDILAYSLARMKQRRRVRASVFDWASWLENLANNPALDLTVLLTLYDSLIHEALQRGEGAEKARVQHWQPFFLKNVRVHEAVKEPFETAGLDPTDDLSWRLMLAMQGKSLEELSVVALDKDLIELEDFPALDLF